MRPWAPAWIVTAPPTSDPPIGANGGCSGCTRYYRAVSRVRKATTTNEPDHRAGRRGCRAAGSACRAAICRATPTIRAPSARAPNRLAGTSPRANLAEGVVVVDPFHPAHVDAVVVFDQPADQAAAGGPADDRLRDPQRTDPPAGLAAAGPAGTHPVVPGRGGVLQSAVADALDLGRIQPDRDRPRRRWRLAKSPARD